MKNHPPLYQPYSGMYDVPPCGVKRKKDSPELLSLIGLGLLGLGVLTLYRLGADVWNGVASHHWSKTGGTIDSSDLELWIGTKSGKKYYFKVVYSYPVAGKTYYNNRISFHESQIGTDEAYCRRELLRTYPRGKAVTVLYDPAKPSRSCLEPGAGYFKPGLLAFLSPIFLGCGFVTLLSSLASLCRECKLLFKSAQKAPDTETQ